MPEACQFLDGCPMFAYFCRAAKKVYREMYCEGDFAACARRQLRMENNPVPDNLLPHGSTLWDDHQKPPKYWE
ncbi:MAG: hypothetical protein GYB65_08910 [Chloroflexi bacterium]|nr:hypothetical protein [Chloroflexota bacterium]